MAERGGCRQKRARYEAESAEAATEGSQLVLFLYPKLCGVLCPRSCAKLLLSMREGILNMQTYNIIDLYSRT